MDEQAIMKIESGIRLGVLEIDTPRDMVARASEIATELAKVISVQKLYSIIQGKKFVHVEGWETLGAMLGIVAREVAGSVVEHENGDFEASVELIRVSDGAIIGYGSALCGCDEVDRGGKQTWGNRARYARRSMAVTRAAGKAFRLSLSWIMKLAGYEPTPAEEMQDQGPQWTVTESPSSQAQPNEPPAPPEPTVPTQPAPAPTPAPDKKNGKVWPAEVITWAKNEFNTKPQQVVGALNQSLALQPTDSIDTIKHWLSIRRTERTAGVEGAEATARADADLLATRQSA